MTAKRKPKKKVDPVVIAGPTPEQVSKGTFQRAGIAYRRVPVIDTLFSEHKLTMRQFKALARYRDVAIADERSPLRDSLDKAEHGAGGAGEHLPPSALRTAIELGRLERALGSLRDVARAIAVDDMTLTAWAAQRYGSRAIERKGVVQFEPKGAAVNIAWVDIRMAGERLASEIGA